MKFFLDHDVPDDVGDNLARLGHNVTFLRDALRIDAGDSEEWAHALRESEILTRCDRDDFLELAAAAHGRGERFAGLLILIRRHSREAECANVRTLLEAAGGAGIANNINFA